MVSHLDAVRALEKVGFRVARQSKHAVMTDGSRIITIPRHDPVNAFTMGGIVREGVDGRGVSEATLNEPRTKPMQLTSAVVTALVVAGAAPARPTADRRRS